MPRRRLSRNPQNQLSTLNKSILDGIYVLLAAISIIVVILSGNITVQTKVILPFVLALCFFIIVIIYSFFSDRERKLIIYCINPHKFIVNANQSQMSQTSRTKMKVIYDNRDVTNLIILLIEFQNKGNTSITMNDFNSEGITVNFGMDAEVIDASIKTDELSAPEIVLGKDKITIRKFESKPHDSWELRVFLTLDNSTSYKDPVIKDIHDFSLNKIDNVNETKKKSIKNIQQTLEIISVSILAFSVLLLIMILFALPRMNISVWMFFVPWTMITIAYLCFTLCKRFISNILNKLI